MGEPPRTSPRWAFWKSGLRKGTRSEGELGAGGGKEGGGGEGLARLG